MRQRRATHKTVYAIGCVISVQRNNSVERMRAKFELQSENFRLARIVPKFAIEIMAVPRKTRVVLEAGRIANRINKKAKVAREFGRLIEQFQKLCGGRSGGNLVTMNRGEEADADGFGSSARP